jgi:hypothetical protein
VQSEHGEDDDDQELFDDDIDDVFVVRVPLLVSIERCTY